MPEKGGKRQRRRRSRLPPMYISSAGNGAQGRKEKPNEKELSPFPVKEKLSSASFSGAASSSSLSLGATLIAQCGIGTSVHGRATNFAICSENTYLTPLRSPQPKLLSPWHHTHTKYSPYITAWRRKLCVKACRPADLDLVNLVQSTEQADRVPLKSADRN